MTSPSTPGIWADLQQLAADHAVVIDRAAGTTHPEHDWIVYPLDYGFLDGTVAADGDGLDVWLGSGDRSRLDAVAVTYDLYKRDVEVKLLLGCTPADIDTIAAFWTQHEMTFGFLEAAEATA